MSELRVLVIDDDPQLCDFLMQVFSSWQMQAKSMKNPLLVISELRETFYNLILLDIVMPEKSGLDLLTEIKELNSYTKVIIMTGYGCKEYIIKALKFGAFDFLEKPIVLDVLSHATKRALDIQRIELEHKKILEDLRNSQKDLLNRHSQLERLNAELVDTNRALAALARHIARIEKRIAREEREEIEKEIVMKIRLFILPIIEKLRRDEALKMYESQLEILLGYIEELTSYSNANGQLKSILSSSEWKVLSMIRNEMTSEAIAAKLHVSLETVKTHRKNIRKKLNISGTKSDLVTYFQSMEEGPTEAEYHRRDET
jgi:FixJ family two-component response regulator